MKTLLLALATFACLLSFGCAAGQNFAAAITVGSTPTRITIDTNPQIVVP